MQRFAFDDTVRIKADAPAHLRPGEFASIAVVTGEEDRRGEFLVQYPQGVVYTVEFEDGSAIQIHESLLEKGTLPSENA